MLGMSERLSRISSGSRLAMRSPGTTSRWATSSSALSTDATPPSTFTFSKTSRAVSGTTSWKVSKPRRCTVAAPFCLPKPMASILERPLSTSPWKSVCALTRLTGSTASARSAAPVERHARGRGAEQHRLHARLEGHVHRLRRDPVPGEHLQLPFGRGASVRAHRGDDERARAEPLQFRHGRSDDLRQARDPAASDADRDGHPRAHPALELAHVARDRRLDRVHPRRLEGLRDTAPLRQWEGKAAFDDAELPVHGHHFSAPLIPWT